jgi:hypothetical protein
MNRHADKLIQESTAKEARQADLGLGGAVGANASRLAG